MYSSYRTLVRVSGANARSWTGHLVTQFAELHIDIGDRPLCLVQAIRGE